MANYDQFKERLTSEKDRLNRMIDLRRRSFDDHAGSGISEAFSNSGDNEFSEHATDLLDKELDGTMLNKYRYRITMVDEALGRIADGSYGTCKRCGAGISHGRLDAIPETAYCRDCEADVEAQD